VFKNLWGWLGGNLWDIKLFFFCCEWRHWLLELKRHKFFLELYGLLFTYLLKMRKSLRFYWKFVVPFCQKEPCYTLTYLCCTTTNIWLRPVEEHLFMTACLEHSASNPWPLRPGYRYSPHPPTWISVFLDFSLQWVWLWIELFVVGLMVFWSCDQRSTIC
jgi:hypothetical protein